LIYGISITTKMEFEGLKSFFAAQGYIKRKYPMIVTYNKYLSKLTEELQLKEIECFKKFFIQNQNLHDRQLDLFLFKTGKQSVTLDMSNFLQTDNEHIEQFWKDLSDLELIMFPNGKPSIEDSTTGPTGLQDALSSLETNPLFAGVIDQIRTSVNNMGDVTDLETIMSSPDFKHIVDNIKTGITNGKYKLKDLTNVVEEIVNVVQKDLDPETQETLQTVTENIRAVERGETPDMGKIMGAISKLKLN